MRQSSPAAEVERREILLEGLIDMGSCVPYTTVSSRLNRTGISCRTPVCPSAPLSTRHIVAEPGSELLTDHGEPLFVAQLVLAQPGAGKDKRQGLAILIQTADGPANERAIARGG